MISNIIISGIGLLSPLGNNVDTFWRNLLSGDYLEPKLYPYDQTLKNERSLYYPIRSIGKSNIDTGSRIVNWGIDATLQALEDANLHLDDLNELNVGIVIGNNIGTTDILEEGLKKDNQSEPFVYNIAQSIAKHIKLTGPVHTVSTACSAGLYSLAIASDYIKQGLVDVVIAGGIESLGVVNQACFSKTGALSRSSCKPFDQDRSGTITSEGAAILILESEEHALRRGKTHNYGFIKGYSLNCDGYHETAPEPEGHMAKQAVKKALKSAKIKPNSIQAILTHGTGTKLNDLAESKVINTVFGQDILSQPYIVSIKGSIGHSVAAAGAFSTIVAALILKYKLCPPSSNLSNLDAQCNLNIVYKKTPLNEIDNILVNAYAFGGNNAALILGR